MRKHYRFTQDEMAAQLGISKSYYSKIEVGVKKVSPAVILAFHCKFAVNCDWLLGGKGQWPPEARATTAPAVVREGGTVYPMTTDETATDMYTVATALKFLADQFHVSEEVVKTKFLEMLLKNDTSWRKPKL